MNVVTVVSTMFCPKPAITIDTRWVRGVSVGGASVAVSVIGGSPAGSS